MGFSDFIFHTMFVGIANKEVRAELKLIYLHFEQSESKIFSLFQEMTI